MGYSDRYDDAEGEERWPAWRPILGIVLGIFLAIAGAAGAARGAAPGSMAELLGRATGALLFCYGIPYYFTLRRAAIAWRIAAFLIIAPMALLATLAQAGRDSAFMRGELGNIRGDMQSALDGNQIAAVGDATTPSGVMRNLLAGLQASQAAYDARVEQSGIFTLLDPGALKRDPAILKDCGTAGRLREELARHRATFDEHVAEARRSIQALPGSADVREGMLEGFDESIAENRRDIERRWALSGQGLAELGTLCTVLARRGWQVEGQDFVFSNARDMADFNASVMRYNAIQTELAALEAAAQAKARGSVREMEKLR